MCASLTAVAAIGLTLVACQPASAAPVYNAISAFDAAWTAGSGNTGSPFSFGYAADLSGAFTAFSQAKSFGPNNVFHTLSPSAQDISPDLLCPMVFHNTSENQMASGSVVLPGNELAFHPGAFEANQYSIIRFTAPQTATYALNAGFIGRDNKGTSTTVFVLAAGQQVFTHDVNGFNNSPVTCTQTFLLTQGQTLDIAVGRGSNGTYYNDSTGLGTNLSITAVPTPAAVWGGSILAGGLLTARCLRRKA
ncbi:MAG: hypothetical protein ACM359_20205 [Bacillota bacterium]